ncbi:hypothetical protein S245_063314, partial [Arachis hypogaea]
PRMSPRSSPQPLQPRSPSAAQPPQPLHRHSLHRHRRRSVAVGFRASFRSRSALSLSDSLRAT